MKIAVCIKQVPVNDAPLRIRSDGLWIDETGTAFETNESDLNALEEALRLRDELDGEVVIVSLGPDRVQQVIRDGLGRGADRGIHIVYDAPHMLEPLQVSSCIAKIAREDDFDLILSGTQSADFGYSQTGINIAELLDMPHASLVVEVAMQPEGIRVRRELEGGAFQWNAINFPCIISIQPGINKPRYAGMKGIMAAKKKTIQKVSVTDDEMVLDTSTFHTLGIFISEKSAETDFVAGSMEEICATLADRLRQLIGER